MLKRRRISILLLAIIAFVSLLPFDANRSTEDVFAVSFSSSERAADAQDSWQTAEADDEDDSASFDNENGAGDRLMVSLTTLSVPNFATMTPPGSLPTEEAAELTVLKRPPRA